MSGKVKVGINGYGVIGKRVADAVSLQDDMELAGVTFNHFDYRIQVAAEKGYPIYSCSVDAMPSINAGDCVRGTVADLLRQVDIMVDCTSKGAAVANKRLYERAGVKAIFQGGESHQLAGVSFTAQVNYAEALNKQFVRVVSCNTTGLCRVMNAFNKRGWVKKARMVIMRRASDPWESHKTGMINTFVPEARVPSHQGPDAKTVIKGLNVVTMAGTASHNLSHIHYGMIEMNREVSREQARTALLEEPRVAFVNSCNGLVALNSVIELMRDLGRPRNDLWEVAVWEDSLAVDGNELYLVYQVHNEAVTVPENIDAIRAISGIEIDAAKSMEKTDRSLGIVKTFLPGTSDDSGAASSIETTKVAS